MDNLADIIVVAPKGDSLEISEKLTDEQVMELAQGLLKLERESVEKKPWHSYAADVTGALMQIMIGWQNYKQHGIIPPVVEMESAGKITYSSEGLCK